MPDPALAMPQMALAAPEAPVGLLGGPDAQANVQPQVQPIQPPQPDPMMWGGLLGMFGF
jgi:hypothetical protein